MGKNWVLPAFEVKINYLEYFVEINLIALIY